MSDPMEIPEALAELSTITVEGARDLDRARAQRINAMAAKQEREVAAFTRAFGCRRTTETLGRVLGYVGVVILGMGTLPGPLHIVTGGLPIVADGSCRRRMWRPAMEVASSC